MNYKQFIRSYVTVLLKGQMILSTVGHFYCILFSAFSCLISLIRTICLLHMLNSMDAELDINRQIMCNDSLLINKKKKPSNNIQSYSLAVGCAAFI